MDPLLASAAVSFLASSFTDVALTHRLAQWHSLATASEWQSTANEASNASSLSLSCAPATPTGQSGKSSARVEK